MHYKRLGIGIFIATLVVYIIGLFPEVGIDSGKYAAVSRIMFENGDWMTPQIHGHPYLHKPHLMFWLSSLSFHLWGLSLFAFKLPSLLFSIVSVVALYRMTKLYYGTKTAWLAVLMYATSEMMFLYHNDLHTDALLTANIVIGVSFLAYYLHNKRAVNFILGFVFIGLAMITKGPVGLAVAVFAVGGHLLMKKDWKNVFNPLWLLAFPILALVLYPTLKSNYNNFGWEGIKFFFWSNNVGRIQGEFNKGGSVDGDMSFYLHTMIYIYLPWSFYTLITIVNQMKGLFIKKGNDRFKRPEYMSYAVIVVYTLILSVANQKAPHYLYPVIPFLSVVVADFVYKGVVEDRNNRLGKWLLGARNVMLFIIAAVLVFILTFVFKTDRLIIWIPVVLAMVVTFYFVLPKHELYKKIIVPLAIASIALNFVLNAHFLPTAFQYHGGIRASDAYSELANENEDLYTYKFRQFETYFYPSKISSWYKEKEDFEKVMNNNHYWVVTDEKGIQEIKEMVGDRISYEKIFPHRLISRMSWDFLNPATREKSLKKVYLLKVD
ncbi:ArnT family glycosyltransferase [Saccharicrinis fermentans]|uniref:Undecaprenyl phosphate-alpha-4-amino-4-deoxy-L-arabinose arabinosyl transferase n=1 Tax=Saccharicrinis fermentans DSM 9555 = JCM 21142 TaxID=869213 RepID=W7Y2V9_9BACT|nr:glycosyltransferase family 39 protein [Saccharicrinis fermentans]GAF02327.1 undecaprenyl phosphate-alpha-4-amino-4-deoxy-L-arabinose arabinosyl transferase [Saccharicrinis fermentans DSM 9555 = JCM 21142]